MKIVSKIVFILLFLFASPVFAAIEKYQDVVQAPDGRGIKNPTITVFATGTTTTVQLYTNITGSTTSNPVTGDSSGRYSFFADEGYYDLLIQGGGYNSRSKYYVHVGPAQATVSAKALQSDFSAHTASTGTNVHGLGTASTHPATDFDSSTHSVATGTNVHGLGTMSTQNADAIAITGGVMSGVTGSSAPASVQNVYSAGTRTIDTVYHNTTGKVMLVTASIVGNTAPQYMEVYADSSNPPTTPISRSYFAGPAGTLTITTTFIVLSGYYYKIVPSTGTPTVDYWTEWY